MPDPTDFKITRTRCCKHCGREGKSSESVLRVQGWRLFNGESQTGKPLNDVVCPTCAGTATEPLPGWRVGCHTCFWEWEDEYDEGPLSKKDAQSIADDHECEPDTWVAPPREKADALPLAPGGTS